MFYRTNRRKRESIEAVETSCSPLQKLYKVMEKIHGEKVSKYQVKKLAILLASLL